MDQGDGGEGVESVDQKEMESVFREYCKDKLRLNLL